MPKLDGIEYKELYGLSVDKENKELFFNDANHLYINKNDGSHYISVTTLIGEYERKHWAPIRNKACIIENDSPYMDYLTKEYLEKKDNEKKWVVKKNFDVFVGKASSVQSHNFNEIKNYVRITPSLPPVLYQFRRNERNKWVSKSDFQLY